MEKISRTDFKELIGWNVMNSPLNIGNLKLINGLNGEYVHCARIRGVSFTIYYNKDLSTDTIHFPIIFEKNNKHFIVKDKVMLEKWVNENCPLSYFTDKVENKKIYMRNSEYNQIRVAECENPNRIVFHELYDWNSENFIGFQCVEY